MWRLTCVSVAVLVVCYGTVAERAVPCDPAKCDSSSCRCSSTSVPGQLELEQIPQFVVLSFDDNVNVRNHPFYQELSNKINPNGCKIKMTFFISHESNDYTLVHDLYRQGHEIAVHSVTHVSNVENYWRNLTKEGWTKEIGQMKEMLVNYANIPPEDIKGFRAPFLEVGGNPMYGALKDAGFEYDCSWPSLHYTPWYKGTDGIINGALWPYTLDYSSVQDKTVGTPPSDSFPGLWVSPMTDLQDNRGIECSMLDACQSFEDELEISAEAVEDLLKRNYKAHLRTRTPFGIYVHHSWFDAEYPNRKIGMQNFLNYLSAFPEVYVVTVGQLLEWVKNPVSFDKVPKMDAFKCMDLSVNKCPKRNHENCLYRGSLPIASKEVYMNICQGPCPANYPYLNNVDGSKPFTNK